MNCPETILALSHRTVEWIRDGGQPTRADWCHRFQQSWQSFWFERTMALSRQLPLPPSTPGDPVFILGLWRSGTTFLHDLLGVCASLIYPTTWQCMHPSLYRLCPVPTRSKSIQRPMDRVVIDTLSPQEDEFALLALGVPSVYRGFLDPRRLLELSRWLNPDSWSCAEPTGWFEAWQAFLVGVIGNQEGRLLLKSPNHTFRIRALIEAFPKASYVWVVRDPAEIWHSNRKMWLSMFRTYALWDWDESVLAEFLQTALRYASQCLSIAIAQLPANRLAVVDFASLTQCPVEYTHALNERLCLAKWADIAESVAAKAGQFAAYRSDVYQHTDFPAPIRTALDALRLAQSQALASHGLLRSVV